MRECMRPVVVAGALLLTSEVCAAQTAATWQEDLRRCLIAKPIDGGRVVVANDEGKLSIDVQRPQDEGETAKYVIRFDEGRSIESAPENNSQTSYPHVLGTYASIAPQFRDSRTLGISITAANKPTEEIRILIGNGARAMAFLKRCEDYWRRYHRRHR